MLLKGKKILLGVGGSISAYKVPELVRFMQKEGADVTVMMSRSAAQFVTPLTLHAISGKPVLQKMWIGSQSDKAMLHIQAGREADLILVAPATANMLARFSYGLADDLIAAAVLASSVPILIAPAMNVQMWKNKILQENVAKLRAAGYSVLDPDDGMLACGEKGEGRLADFSKIVYEVKKLLTKQDLKGKCVLITAGPTREYADPVRFMSNASSGKMGKALALETYFRGAAVTVVKGPLELDLPEGIKVIDVVSAKEMADAVSRFAKNADIFISAAAVSDVGFKKKSKQKKEKSNLLRDSGFALNEDILAGVSKMGRKPFSIGFALETHDHLHKGLKKMAAKKADLMVINGIDTVGSENAAVTLVWGQGRKKLPSAPKENIAENILSIAVKLL